MLAADFITKSWTPTTSGMIAWQQQQHFARYLQEGGPSTTAMTLTIFGEESIHVSAASRTPGHPCMLSFFHATYISCFLQEAQVGAIAGFRARKGREWRSGEQAGQNREDCFYSVLAVCLRCHIDANAIVLNFGLEVCDRASTPTLFRCLAQTSPIFIMKLLCQH